MDENKINPEVEETAVTPAEQAEPLPEEEATVKPATETPAAEEGEKKEKKPKAKKPRKLRNQALLRRGGYSVAITAAVLAGIIVLNVLLGALAKRFVLEFDMSAEKKNSVSEENIDFLRKLDKEVSITVCADKDNYVGGYMGYYAQNLYNISSDASEYYNQTVKLLDKYPAYNSRISLRYVDTQDTKFTEISAKYSNERLHYGDIIVSAGEGEQERHKIVGFTDIYAVSEDSTYAAYGYSTSQVSGNNVETAVTGAIAYVTSDKMKKVAVLTGHSANDLTAEYQTLLKANNYDISVISDAMITSISDEFDAVIIVAPTVDFMENELNALAEFLDHDDQLGKGLLFFADATAPYLPNFYDFLSQWGIAVEEGILFETNDNNHMPDEPMTMGMYPAGTTEELTAGMQLCITGYNVPITAAFESEGNIATTSLITTPESVVAAPVGTSATWTGAGDYTKKSYTGVLQAKQTDYNKDNQEISSYVFAFSSVEFLNSIYNEQSSVANKDITLACAERAVGAENTGVSFVSKTITNESFADSVSESNAMLIRVIFMVLLPLAMIAAGIVIFVRRRNAQ